MSKLILGVLAVFGSTASLAFGQNIPGPPLTTAECDSAAALLSGGERDPTGWAILSSCGSPGATALAGAIQAASSETDADYLQWLYFVASNIRDPAILGASGTLTENTGATVESRVIGILLLLSQFDNGLGPRLDISFATLLTSPAGANCPIGVTYPGPYASRSQLQSDSLRRIVSPMETIKNDPNESQILRDLAACTRNLLTIAVPIRVNERNIHLTYICGNRFRVSNSSPESIMVTFDVDQTDKTGDFTVPPNADVVFTARGTGTVRLFYFGQLVQTKANGGLTCR